MTRHSAMTCHSTCNFSGVRYIVVSSLNGGGNMLERNHWVLLSLFGYIIALGFLLVGFLSDNWLLVVVGIGSAIGLAIMIDAIRELVMIDLQKSEIQLPLKGKDEKERGAR